MVLLAKGVGIGGSLQVCREAACENAGTKNVGREWIATRDDLTSGDTNLSRGSFCGYSRCGAAAKHPTMYTMTPECWPRDPGPGLWHRGEAG